MAKKNEPDLHKGISIGFRADRQELVDALDQFAASIRRSRNMAMILLFEEALENHGFWPPDKSK